VTARKIGGRAGAAGGSAGAGRWGFGDCEEGDFVGEGEGDFMGRRTRREGIRGTWGAGKKDSGGRFLSVSGSGRG
jgi:hypothetical protein